MTEYDKLYEIGKRVDNLQQLNNQGQELSAIFSTITELEEYFCQNKKSTDIDMQIIFNYTKANYMTVLMEIAQRHEGVVHEKRPYLQYKSKNDFLYDYEIQRLSLLREALTLYKKHPESKIAETWMNQVRVNLAIIYNETGRIVESFDILESCKDIFGMARINYASKLYVLSFYVIEKELQKELLSAALQYYESAITQYPERQEYDPIPTNIFQSIIAAKMVITNELETQYKDIPDICDLSDNMDCNLDVNSNRYKLWCRDNHLILAIRNIYQIASLSDDIHLPNMGIAYFAHDNSLSYYSWFNTLKQEYNQSRYFLYLAQCGLDNYDVHESQEDVLLINTLDYPAIGYRSELLKCALKTAYGVLDKIGLLCNDFVRGKNMPVHKVGFTSWFQGIENEIRLNNNFTSLYWVARDLSRSGNFKTFRLLRNVIEHRYLRIIDAPRTSLEDELFNEGKMEYIISFSELQSQTYEILKLIRALLFYVVFAFNACYLETLKACDKNNQFFIPLVLDYYDDEWKN